MAWVKVPKESHAILMAALPKDPRIRLINMFGATAALVNGNIFGGTFARSAIVRLDGDEFKEALALDGAEPFDPMGNKRVMNNTVLLPETVMDEPAELKRWLALALAYTLTLPPKKKGAKKKPAPKRAKPVQRTKRPKAALRKRAK